MDQFTRDDLKRLVATENGKVITFYMPTYRSGPEVRQNAIRFKNLIKAANEQLEQHFPEEQPLLTQLHEAARLEADDAWWQHQSDGLAMFLSAGQFDRYRVPLEVEEFVSVGTRFHVRPMVRLLQGDGRFWVLAVSQKRVRLLKGTHYSVDELPADQLPMDVRSALNIDEYTSSLQHHSTRAVASPGTTIFHGHGAADMDVRKKDEILQFFHRIDTALNAYFGQEQLPLVFAGVDYLFPLFRDACQHRNLVDQPVTGNPDEVPATELHRQAWAVVAPEFAKRQQAALARFQDAAGGPTAINRLEKIIPVARQGAVDTLLLADGERRWGLIDELTGEIQLSDQQTTNSQDLLNDAAVHTLTHGGVVYSLPPERIPDQTPAAAILRFPLPTASSA